MVRHARVNLLSHRLCEAYLRMKWHVPLKLVSIFTHIQLLVCNTLYEKLYCTHTVYNTVLDADASN